MQFGKLYGLPFYNHDIIGVNFRKILKQSGVKAIPLYNLRDTMDKFMVKFENSDDKNTDK